MKDYFCSMIKAYLLLGSNMGDRKSYLERALEEIGRRAGRITAVSSIHSTEPWGNEDQDEFLNQAVEIETESGALELLKSLLLIETGLGRVRDHKWAPRTIDIDILLYGNEIVSLPELSVPHPYLHERRFALAPLMEIAPDLIHPVLKRSVSQLLRECTDPRKASGNHALSSPIEKP